MPKQCKLAPLPDGERLLLTIDRVVERDCVYCRGHGTYPTVAHDGVGEISTCPKCHGTGRRKVRVRGWIELNYEYDFDFEDFSLDLLRGDCDGSFYYGGPLEEAQDAIVAAYLAGTLPPDIAANITEEDVPDDS